MSISDKKEYFKNYYNNNKDRYREYDRKRAELKYYCVCCKSTLEEQYRKKHEKTQIHIKNQSKYDNDKTLNNIEPTTLNMVEEIDKQYELLKKLLVRNGINKTIETV